MKKVDLLKRRVFLAASLSVLVVAVLMAFGFYQCVFAAEAKPIVQKTFKSPEEAAKGLMDAVKSNDTKELMAIFGPAGKELVSSGDEVADKGESSLSRTVRKRATWRRRRIVK